MPIFLHNEDRSHFLINQDKTIDWIKDVARLEDHVIGDLNYIFCSDEYLIEINKNYLNHDYYTDVITFDHSVIYNEISGDIFISVDRVTDYSEINSISAQLELQRVMIHGFLHLVGYLDKTEDDKNIMTKAEDVYLLLVNK